VVHAGRVGISNVGTVEKGDQVEKKEQWHDNPIQLSPDSLL